MENNRSNLIKMGKHISDLRKQNGYTQKKLGELLDISDKTISKWEQGTIAPDITILKSLAVALGVSVDEILSGEKEVDNEFRNDSNDISVFSNQTRKKILSDSIVIIFFFLIIIMFVMSLNKKDRWEINKINVNDDISFSGFTATNDDDLKIFLYKLVPSESVISSRISNVRIDIYDDETIIFSEKLNVENNKSLNDVFDQYYIIFEDNEIIGSGELSVVFVLYNGDSIVNMYQYFLD